jgi:hypothetical protein
MGWLRRSQQLARDTDPLFSWGERAWKAVLWIFGPSVLVGAPLTVLGWIVYNPLYGVLIGLGAFAIAQAGLTFNAIRKSAAQRGPLAGLGQAALTPTPTDDESLPFPLPRPLPPDWSSRRTLFNLSFRLVDLIAPDQVMNQTNVRDKTFYRCTIHGPAILIPRDTRFDGDNKFLNEPRTEHPQSMLYAMTPDQNRTWFSGTVSARDCVFRDCTFVDIGLMHYEPNIRRLRDHIVGEGDVKVQ